MKLRVENLARIKEAEVEVKNLTLFVGQNSTHKSYMAHVVYELFKEISNIGDNTSKNNNIVSAVIKKIFQNYQNDIEYLKTLKKEVTEEEDYHQYAEDEYETEVYTVVSIFIQKDDETINNLIKNIYLLIQDEFTTIIDSSFNSTNKIIEKLFIDNQVSLSSKNQFSFRFDMPIEYFNNIDEDITPKLIARIVRILLENLKLVLNEYLSSYYFPASRTGFVLTLDEIYAGIFRDKFRGQASATRLGEPTIDFIQTFADIKTGTRGENFLFSLLEYGIKNDKKSEKLISFLEKEIIKGKIKEYKNEQDYTSYYLSVNGTELDLHLASSATLETLPFIVFLKNTQDISKTLFVIEEPEAHLHPKAQIQMAKFIVMLSNAGAKVLVTTHSDYILNEINNCIKLNSLEEKSEFSISKDDISAYLFKNEEHETTVKALTIDKFGIANDNFDEALEELLDLSNDLNERIVDNE